MAKNPNISVSMATDKARQEIQQLKSELTGLQKEFKLSSETMKNTSTENEKLSAKIQSLSKQLETQKDITNKTREAVNNATKAWAESAKQVENAKQKLKAAEQSQNSTAKEIAKLKKEVESAEKAFNNNGLAVQKWKNNLTDSLTSEEKFRNSISEVNAELLKSETNISNTSEQIKALANNTENTSNSIEKMAKTLSDVGKDLTLSVTTPIVAVGTAAAKSAIDFETAFAGVSKTVDATDKELSVLKQGIRDMAKEIPSSVDTIAQVAESAGQLAIEKENILDFTRTMIDLGESTNLTAEEAAMALAKFANVAQMSQKDFEKLGSVIVDLGNNTATTEADIVAMATRLSSAGAQINMSEADIMSFAASLSSVGIEAEAGGSSFSKVMLEMQMAVQQGEDAVTDFAGVANMSIDEFCKLFKEDATSAIIAFIEGLGKIENAAEVLDALGLAEIRVRNSLLSAANASNVFKDAIETGRKAWEENTALTIEAEKRYETTESKLRILKNTLTDTAIELGNNFLPTIQNLAQDIGNFVSKFGELDKSTQQSIIKFGALAASIGPVTGAFGNLIKLASSLGTTFNSVGGFSNVLASGLSAIISPAGGVAAILSLVTAGVIAYTKAQEEQRQALLNSKDTLYEVSQAYDNISSKADSLQNLSDKWQELNSIIKDNETSSEDLSNAKNQIAEIEQELIDKSDGLINRYDIENGKIAEKINLLKEQSDIQKQIAQIDLQQTINSIDIGKLQSENEVLKQRQQILTEQLSTQQEAYTKLALAQKEYEAAFNEDYSDKQIEKFEQIKQKANEAGEALGLDFTDNLELLRGATETANEELQKNNEELQRLSEEYNNSLESIEAYYETSLKLIEANLGGEFLQQVEVVGLMKTALDDLSESGIISDAVFQQLKNVFPDLTQNTSDTSQNMSYLRSRLEELEQKVLTAKTAITNLNGEISALPDEKKIDVTVSVYGMQSLKELKATIDSFEGRLKGGPSLSQEEERAYGYALDEYTKRLNNTKQNVAVSTAQENKYTYTPYSAPKTSRGGSSGRSSSAKSEAEKAAREAEKQRKEELKAWEKHWKDREELSKDWISTEKFYNRLSEEEEVAAYGRLIEFLKEALAEIETLEIATDEEKLELKKEFNKKIVNAEKQQYTASKALVNEQLKDQEKLRDKKLDSLEDQIEEQESLIEKVKLYKDTRQQLESNMIAEIDAINEKFWLNEKQRLEEADDIYEQYADKIKKIDKDIYSAKKELITKAANDMKQSQLDLIESDMKALETAYNKQSEFIKQSKTKKVNAINEQKQAALNALDEEQRRAEQNFNNQLKNIENLGNARIEALQAQIDAINKSAISEDRAYDLDKLEKLYASYSKSSTAEGQQKAEELRRQIRDIKNEEKIEGLNDEIKNAQKELDAEKEKLQMQQQLQSNSYESQKAQLELHYNSMLSSTESYYDSMLEKVTANYEHEKELLEQKKYIVEKTNKEILDNVDSFAKENIDLYGQNQSDILNLLSSKEGEYYSTAQKLGQAYYRGLQEEMEKVNSYIKKISVPNMPNALTSPISNTDTFGSSKVNYYNLSVNDYGTKNFKDDVDIDSYNKELGNTLINRAKYGFGQVR